jgi:hypothetical protein
MPRWRKGQDTINALVERGHLQQVAADTATAEMLVATSERRARLRHRRRDDHGVVGDPDARELLARRTQPHDDRPAAMKVDPDILSIHRGLPSSWVWL